MLPSQLGIVCAVLMISQRAVGVVIEFTNADGWQIAADDFTTINFTGFSNLTVITTQYQDEGVTFTDGNDLIDWGGSAYPNDGRGLAGSFDSTLVDINIIFDEPQFSVAVDYPGAVRIQLFLNDELMYTSSNFGGTGVGFFAGLVSTEPFDSAVLHDWNAGAVFIDDLHFGVPTPSVVSLIGMAIVFGRHRRRQG